MSKGARPVIIAALGVACLAIADACNIDLNSPNPRGASSPRVPGEPSFDIAASADQIVATTSSPSIWNGAETNANANPIATFPTATWYRVQASGRITMTPDPRFMPGQPIRTYGPSGYARFTWSYGGINTTNVMGNPAGDSSATIYVQMSGSLASADRPGVGTVSWNGYCGVGYSDPCGDYSGPSTTFTFTRLDADLTLAADSTMFCPDRP